MSEPDEVNELEKVAAESRLSEVPFPVDPFPCPACGQLLAASCRVCVACKHVIDPDEIRQPEVAQVVAPPERRLLEPVRFSWRTFLIVFVIWVVGASLVQSRMTPTKAQLVLGGVQVLCAFWAFFDAREKRLPRPFRWGTWTLLLLPLIFPWYLARRSRPGDPCPFESVSPRKLAVLFILLAILSYVIYKNPPPPH